MKCNFLGTITFIQYPENFFMYSNILISMKNDTVRNLCIYLAKELVFPIMAPSFFRTIPQRYNFRTISHWSLLTLFFFFFSLCFLVTNRFYQTFY